MPQSSARVWLHVVFSTKNRHGYLKHDGFRDEMFRMLGHHAKQIDCLPLRVGRAFVQAGCPFRSRSSLTALPLLRGLLHHSA